MNLIIDEASSISAKIRNFIDTGLTFVNMNKCILYIVAHIDFTLLRVALYAEKVMGESLFRDNEGMFFFFFFLIKN
jgi:hypothetical protein